MGLFSSKPTTIEQINIDDTPNKPITINIASSSSPEGSQDTTSGSGNILDCNLKTAINTFESKARETSLSNLTAEAKQILNVFKLNVEVIKNPNINITFKKW
eukprot:CAMPEP_0201572426 /NCGR_PEP_ID=MMETSP0190_2-20130828/15685_1 /ASSEMBLY_ACC=CAM_ASM_000263 /TAXON_ID=37353 /ORGANISM="Rosalina sp." /LENGTH=101 /DNA_ID=CAMNT_0047998165 /DNA_START=32 /DNA_END=334 /DNA_ORIENTATION=-